MVPTIAFIGAGSTVFTRNLLRDLFLFPELHGSRIALMDIDPQRLRDSEMVAHKVATAAQARPEIFATTDRRAALDGADYVIVSIQVGGYQPSLAALMQTNISVQTLVVEAALSGKREHMYHAAMLDPHTGAELDLEQITALVDDLVAAHGELLPQFR